MAPRFAIKRVYAPADPGDGLRVLVDRLWPRGLSRQRAGIDHWLKSVAPSPALRQWFGHDPARWQEFSSRYRAELEDNHDEVDLLRRMDGKVTLLYGARDEVHNQAVVLLDFLQSNARDAQ